MNKIIQILCGLVLLLSILGPVSAQVSEYPKRWMTVSEVVQQYGEPIRKSNPVGSPVITFWEYGNFVVFFEADRVLHTISK